MTKQMDFSKIRHKNVEYFNLVHAHNPKFGLFLPLSVSNFLLALFLSFFLGLFYSCYLLRFISFLAVSKS